MSLFGQVEKWVEESFKDSPGTVRHLRRTVDWIDELRPGADEALRIAAIAHDIERSERVGGKNPESFTDTEYLRHHQERGAEMLGAFLEGQHVESSLIEKAKALVAKHEEGGSGDQNLLKDADSLSFFDTQVDNFLNKAKESGAEVIREKFQWMFDRITSPEAKEKARPAFREALKRLDKNNLAL